MALGAGMGADVDYAIATSAALVRPLGAVSDGEWAAIARHALPPGFRYVVTGNQQVVEPILFYLQDKCIKTARIRSVGNTQTALCTDLYEWFSYLAVVGQRWDSVETGDIETYRDRLLTSVSPKTGKPYARTTVRRRLTTILDFYRWARREGASTEDVDDVEVRRLPRDYRRDAMAHIHGGDDSIAVNRLLPQAYADDRIDALAPEDLRRVLHELGSRPGERGDPRPCRDRLIAYLAVATGMRLDECASLTLVQFLGLRKDPHYGNVPMPLTKTKGLRPRTVILPEAVHTDIMTYIETERARALRGQRKPSPALFVNGEQATRNRGGALTAHSIWRAFHRAVMAAGVTRSVTVEGPTGRETRVEALHSFHDLRHTFAMVMYFELQRAGKAEPWLALRSLLGHRHLSTTINTYLRSVQAKEALMTDALHVYLKALRDG